MNNTWKYNKFSFFGKTLLQTEYSHVKVKGSSPFSDIFLVATVTLAVFTPSCPKMSTDQSMYRHDTPDRDLKL